MDAAVKQQAGDLYILHGFSMQTITDMLKGQVTRKTLYNWKDKFGWDALRKNEVKKKETIQEDIYDLLQTSITEAKVSPTPNNIFAVAKLVGILKTLQAVKIAGDDDDEKNDKPKGASEETIRMIMKEMGLTTEE